MFWRDPSNPAPLHRHLSGGKQWCPTSYSFKNKGHEHGRLLQKVVGGCVARLRFTREIASAMRCASAATGLGLGGPSMSQIATKVGCARRTASKQLSSTLRTFTQAPSFKSTTSRSSAAWGTRSACASSGSVAAAQMALPHIVYKRGISQREELRRS